MTEMSDRPEDRGDSLDFFGASPPPTLPVPSTTAPTTPVPTAPGPTTPGPTTPREPPGADGIRRGLRVRTVVFGLVMLAISVASLLVMLAGVRLNGTVTALAVLAGAGAALVLGGLTAAVRDLRRAGSRSG